jgi:hypothetical protein
MALDYYFLSGAIPNAFAALPINFCARSSSLAPARAMLEVSPLNLDAVRSAEVEHQCFDISLCRSNVQASLIVQKRIAVTMQ